MVSVVAVDAAATHPLRRSVLRDGTASDAVEFDGDDLDTTFHLGVRLDDELVAISTWMQRRYPDLPEHVGFQLRGMATDPARRGGGIGGSLLAAGVTRCRELGGGVIWARARVPAIGFYQRHGFETRGAEYVDLTTGLPHRDIVSFLA